jgi:hypothetical protein
MTVPRRAAVVVFVTMADVLVLTAEAEPFLDRL